MNIKKHKKEEVYVVSYIVIFTTWKNGIHQQKDAK
jgi:hypothetical protein